MDVLRIIGKNAVLLREGVLRESHGCMFLLNSEEIPDELKRRSLVINDSDVLQKRSNGDVLIEYRRGEERMSIDEFKSKPTYYHEESTEEHTLRCIANRKELKGFEAYKEKPKFEDVVFRIVGQIEDTGSLFIDCVPSANKYSKDSVLFTIHGSRIAMNEYLKLSEKYKDQASFGTSGDRSYLRFTKINNSYAFRDSYPFGDSSYRKAFTSLDKATDEEIRIRNIVSTTVHKAVFHTSLGGFKPEQLLNQLRLLSKVKNKALIKEGIDLIIDDLSKHIRNISK